jgi:hypothetical protein
VTELFTKGSHHCNIASVLITQNLFCHGSSSQGILLNSKYMTMFKNSQTVHLGRQIYPENVCGFHEASLSACKENRTYLFLDLSQSVKDLLRFRTKIFPCGLTEVRASFSSSNETVGILRLLHRDLENRSF